MAIIKTERLEPKDYIQSEHNKDLIVLHHTVGGTAISTIDYWKSNRERVATAYVVERDGDIYEVFEPKHWAYHLGIKGSDGAVDKRSIGIEIASEGGLMQYNGNLYCYDKVTSRTLFTQPYYDHGMPWRGYRFYDAYSDAQIASTIQLINNICDKYGVPRQTPANHLDFDNSHRNFKGILGHHHLRQDKSDVHPGFPWQHIVEQCSLELI